MLKNKKKLKDSINLCLAIAGFSFLIGNLIIGGSIFLVHSIKTGNWGSSIPFRMYYGLIFGLLGLIIGLILLFFDLFPFEKLSGKACSICGIKSKFGYSEHAEEDAKKIKNMCLHCLITQLEKNYSNFTGRAVVIQPAVGLPCYVYQPIKEWQKYFTQSKLGTDVISLLAEMKTECHDCGQKANYLWVESDGLNGDNFSKTLDKGLSETLLQDNPQPVSLCAKCVVRLIRHNLREKQLSYLEVCGPNGVGDGFVIPMGY